MIVLDCSVLSAFTKLDIVVLLQNLNTEIASTTAVLEEYSKLWQEANIPEFITIAEIEDNEEVEPPRGPSRADRSLLTFAKQKHALLATDDKPLRQEATRQDIDIIGLIGLLKLMLIKEILSKNQYLELIDRIQDDIYLDDSLINWAKDV